MFEQVSSLLHDLDDGMRPISVLFPYLPTEPHRKRDRCVAAPRACCVARKRSST